MFKYYSETVYLRFRSAERKNFSAIISRSRHNQGQIQKRNVYVCASYTSQPDQLCDQMMNRITLLGTDIFEKSYLFPLW